MDAYYSISYFGKRKRENGGTTSSRVVDSDSSASSCNRMGGFRDPYHSPTTLKASAPCTEQQGREDPPVNQNLVVSCDRSVGSVDNGDDWLAQKHHSGMISWKESSTVETIATTSSSSTSSSNNDDGGYLPSSSECYSSSGCDGRSSCTSPFSSSSSSADEPNLSSYLKRSDVSNTPLKNDTTTDPCPFLALGSDVMATVVSFLEPAETLRLLTMPLCREWRRSYTAHHDLWRTLCCTDPFSANLGRNNEGYPSSDDDDDDKSGWGQHSDDDTYDDDDHDSFCTLGDDDHSMLDTKKNGNGDCDVLGEYRLLYTSFVRCLKYLNRIKEDTQNGRPPSVMDYGTNYSRFPTFGVTKSLKKFLSKKKHGSLKSVIGSHRGGIDEHATAMNFSSAPIGVMADGRIRQVRRTNESVGCFPDSFLLLGYLSISDLLLFTPFIRHGLGLFRNG
jgi:hypothetical protein